MTEKTNKVLVLNPFTKPPKRHVQKWKPTKTVQGRAASMREHIDRYQNGILPPPGSNELYDDDDHIAGINVNTLDRVDIMMMAHENKVRLENLQSEMQKAVDRKKLIEDANKRLESEEKDKKVPEQRRGKDDGSDKP